MVGRHRLFNFIARRFERDPRQAERDGAFLAGLLDGVVLRVGKPYFVHLDDHEKDHNFPPDHHLHNFREGLVVEVTVDEFAVKLDTSLGPEVQRLPLANRCVPAEEILAMGLTNVPSSVPEEPPSHQCPPGREGNGKILAAKEQKLQKEIDALSTWSG